MFLLFLDNSYTKINTNGARKDKSVGISWWHWITTKAINL